MNFFVLQKQAAANPVFLATYDQRHFVDKSIYWNGLAECTPSVEANDTVLAYRLWEISENILINRTNEFDDFLSQGDAYSSFTKLDNDESTINMRNLTLLIDPKINES